MKRAYLAALMLAQPVASTAQPVTVVSSVDVRLSPGDAVTLTASDSQATTSFRVRESGRAQMSAYDLAAVARVSGTRCDLPACAAILLDGGDLPPAPVVAADVVRVSFTTMFLNGHAVLVIENGFDRAITYRAPIKANGSFKSTDVCLVPPGKRGYEHWPYIIDQIELTDITLVAWQPADGIPCA